MHLFAVQEACASGPGQGSASSQHPQHLNDFQAVPKLPLPSKQQPLSPSVPGSNLTALPLHNNNSTPMDCDDTNNNTNTLITSPPQVPALPLPPHLGSPHSTPASTPRDTATFFTPLGSPCTARHHHHPDAMMRTPKGPPRISPRTTTTNGSMGGNGAFCSSPAMSALMTSPLKMKMMVGVSPLSIKISGSSKVVGSRVVAMYSPTLFALKKQEEEDQDRGREYAAQRASRHEQGDNNDVDMKEGEEEEEEDGDGQAPTKHDDVASGSQAWQGRSPVQRALPFSKVIRRGRAQSSSPVRTGKGRKLTSLSPSTAAAVGAVGVVVAPRDLKYSNLRELSFADLLLHDPSAAPSSSEANKETTNATNTNTNDMRGSIALSPYRVVSGGGGNMVLGGGGGLLNFTAIKPAIRSLPNTPRDLLAAMDGSKHSSNGSGSCGVNNNNNNNNNDHGNTNSGILGSPLSPRKRPRKSIPVKAACDIEVGRDQQQDYNNNNAYSPVSGTRTTSNKRATTAADNTYCNNNTVKGKGHARATTGASKPHSRARGIASQSPEESMGDGGMGGACNGYGHFQYCLEGDSQSMRSSPTKKR